MTHLWTLKVRRFLKKTQNLYHLSIVLNQSVPLTKCFSVESRERIKKTEPTRDPHIPWVGLREGSFLDGYLQGVIGMMATIQPPNAMEWAALREHSL